MDLGHWSAQLAVPGGGPSERLGGGQGASANSVDLQLGSLFQSIMELSPSAGHPGPREAVGRERLG